MTICDICRGEQDVLTVRIGVFKQTLLCEAHPIDSTPPIKKDLCVRCRKILYDKINLIIKELQKSMEVV